MTSEQDSISNYSLFDYISSLRAEDYYEMLDSLKNGQPCDYFSLRMAYTKTENYSPYGNEISDSLEKVINLYSEDNYQEALVVLENILKREFVNIKAHIYTSNIYKKVEDSVKSQYHKDIYNELLNSIYQLGNGRNPQNAYIVISTDEEYDLLRWFGLNLIQQSLIGEDGHFFDLLEVKDSESDEEHKIYFNITIPYQSLNKSLSK